MFLVTGRGPRACNGYLLAQGVDEPVVIEDSRTVSITIPTRVFVPGRNSFKQLSATLGRTTVTLREPLGDRSVVDGVTHAPITRAPTLRG